MVTVFISAQFYLPVACASRTEEDSVNPPVNGRREQLLSANSNLGTASGSAFVLRWIFSVLLKFINQSVNQ